MRKGTFFKQGSAQCCHHLRWEKAVFVEKGYVFFTICENTVNRGAEIKPSPRGLVVNEMQKQYNFKMANTLFVVSFSPLFTHRYTVDQQAPPPGSPGEIFVPTSHKRTNMCAPFLFLKPHA